MGRQELHLVNCIIYLRWMLTSVVLFTRLIVILDAGDVMLFIPISIPLLSLQHQDALVVSLIV